MRNGGWNDNPAIGQKNNAGQRNALSWGWQRAEDREIPEQDLEQDWKVAQQFDIAAGDSRQQPVRREPAQRDSKSDQGGEENADDRDQQRIQQADEEYARICVGLGIRNQALIDVKACVVVEKSEPGCDVLRL